MAESRVILFESTSHTLLAEKRMELAHMQEYSLEQISESIHYGKSRDYFKEVLSSYSNGNYRSAVVMLWSVAVCDIVFKLQNLIDLYTDASAKEILDNVTSIQEANAKSSEWELKLIEDVHRKTNLLDSSEYENLRYLQQQRHLSAHPVLNSERELHSPNKETVRSLLRNTLEGLLIKPPFYTQHIMNELLADISEASPALNTRKKAKKYVVSRYLNRTTPAVELNMFRSLWKLVFKLDNENCEMNRNINLYTLEVLSSRNIGLLDDYIRGDIDYFSNIASSGNPLSHLVYYLAHNPQLFSLFSEDARLKIEHHIETDKVGKTMGWFIKTDLEHHANDIKDWITGNEHPTFTPGQFDTLLELSDSDEWENRFCELVSDYYSSSYSYDQADKRYQVAIPKYINLFTSESLVYLAHKINDNCQCYDRGRARQDYEVIKCRIDEVFNNDFNYDDCTSFKRKVVVAESIS